jgi:hypothetical protein
MFKESLIIHVLRSFASNYLSQLIDINKYIGHSVLVARVIAFLSSRKAIPAVELADRGLIESQW